MIRSALCLFSMSLGHLLGQSPILAGTGYSNPSIIRVAPGQITTLFVTGLKTVLPSQPVRATSLPLPATLAGISITLSQNGQQPSPIPLLSVQQMPICSDGDVAPPQSGVTPDCLITAITVQIPFELLLPPEGPTAALAVNENGSLSKGFRVFSVSANLHVLNWCDAFPPERLNICGGVATHGDGTPITSDSPAKAGETVVIYAFGLGQTTPAAKTGDAASMPAPTLRSTIVAAQFDFRPNAMPSNPYAGPKSTGISGPAFVGLTPGQVGLYQINVKIPETVPAVVPCSTALGVASNLTIDIGSSTSGGLSFDGAPICVEAPR
ncbi:MAG TPA: hypothetical protein VNY05_03500 [Candidatus Acidoferrales bacterium]|nr:hypothetical protein [Candidatus Acidoferrales bacterium]